MTDKRTRGGSTKGSRPNNGGKRPGTGPKPDLVAVVQGVGISLSHHQHKFSQVDLRELQDATGALLQQIRMLLPEVEEWDGVEAL